MELFQKRILHFRFVLLVPNENELNKWIKFENESKSSTASPPQIRLNGKPTQKIPP